MIDDNFLKKHLLKFLDIIIEDNNNKSNIHRIEFYGYGFEVYILKQTDSKGNIITNRNLPQNIANEETLELTFYNTDGNSSIGIRKNYENRHELLVTEDEYNKYRDSFIILNKNINSEKFMADLDEAYSISNLTREKSLSDLLD